MRIEGQKQEEGRAGRWGEERTISQSELYGYAIRKHVTLHTNFFKKMNLQRPWFDMGSNCNYDFESREVAGATASPAVEHTPCPFQREAG